VAELYNALTYNGPFPPADCDLINITRHFNVKGYRDSLVKGFQKHRRHKVTDDSMTSDKDKRDARIEKDYIETAISALSNICDGNGNPDRIKIYGILRRHSLDKCGENVTAFIRKVEVKVRLSPTGSIICFSSW
jgi:hypothetical protein